MKASFSAIALKWPSNPLTCITDTVHNRLVLMNLWNCSFQSCSELCSCLPPHPFLYLPPGAASISLIHSIQWMLFQHFGRAGFTCLSSHPWFKTVGILKEPFVNGIRICWAYHLTWQHFFLLFPDFLCGFCTSSWTARFQGKKESSYCVFTWSLPGWVCALHGVCDRECPGVWGYFRACRCSVVLNSLKTEDWRSMKLLS